MKISTLLICVFSVFAIILNIEGSNCIVQISSLPQSNNNSSNNNAEESNDREFSNQPAERQLQPLQEDNQSQDTLTPEQEQEQEQQSYELRKYCFLVTNLYVYSLFGVIIGFIILVLWYVRYKKIWSWKQKGSTN